MLKRRSSLKIKTDRNKGYEVGLKKILSYDFYYHGDGRDSWMHDKNIICSKSDIFNLLTHTKSAFATIWTVSWAFLKASWLNSGSLSKTFLPNSHSCENIEGKSFDFCSDPVDSNSVRRRRIISKCFLTSDWSRRCTNRPVRSKSSSSGVSLSTVIT